MPMNLRKRRWEMKAQENEKGSKKIENCKEIFFNNIHGAKKRDKEQDIRKM